MSSIVGYQNLEKANRSGKVHYSQFLTMSRDIKKFQLNIK